MAPSSCSSWRKRENSGANFCVSFWERNSCHHFWNELVHEINDIRNNTTTMNFANGPIDTNRS